MTKALLVDVPGFWSWNRIRCCAERSLVSPISDSLRPPDTDSSSTPAIWPVPGTITKKPHKLHGLSASPPALIHSPKINSRKLSDDKSSKWRHWLLPLSLPARLVIPNTGTVPTQFPTTHHRKFTVWSSCYYATHSDPLSSNSIVPSFAPCSFNFKINRWRGRLKDTFIKSIDTNHYRTFISSIMCFHCSVKLRKAPSQLWCFP